jgi:signal transduction histidine kinase
VSDIVNVLDLAEALVIACMGLALAILGAVFLASRRALDRSAAILLVMAGIFAFGWKAPFVVTGVDEDASYAAQAAQAGFFLCLAVSLYMWASSLLARHATMLQEAQEQLRAALGEKQMYIDILAHDLKNPLTVARGRAERVAKALPEDARDVPELQRSLHQMGAIVEDSLLYSQLETDGPQLERPQADLAATVRHAALQLKPLADAKGVWLAVYGVDALACRADRLLPRAIENVVSNAIKWSPSGAQISIFVGEGGGDGECEVRVVDHGPGIPDADKAKLFARFQRADRHGVAGTGLGLAIARRVVALHRGSLRIEDTPGGGATFVLTLPAALVTSPAPASSSREAPA